MITSTYPGQPAPHPATAEPMMVFRDADPEATVPLSRVLGMLDLVELIRSSADPLDPDTLSELVSLSDRIDLKIVTPGEQHKRLEVVASEKELLNLLLAQMDASAGTRPGSPRGVRCPQCRADRAELLLATCAHCGYDFVLGAGVAQLWQPVVQHTG